MKSPNHIAIIMDGNGRWGLKNYNSRLIGHEYGVKNIKSIINCCLKYKIKNLTLFVLSSDNLAKRDKRELDNLFVLLECYLKNNINSFEKENINLNFIGESQNLSNKIKNILIQHSNKIKIEKRKLNINIALNYSSKKEIISSCKQIVKKNKSFNVKNISKYLYTAPTKNPEILIRTGGYSRLSDFLLWQCSYTEIFFIKKLWPDFKERDLSLIINKFKKLKRNFGS